MCRECGCWPGAKPNWHVVRQALASVTALQPADVPDDDPRGLNSDVRRADRRSFEGACAVGPVATLRFGSWRDLPSLDSESEGTVA